ncbi:hypothetical protein FE257_008025 [Aspergillus nanangensis]|uniref:Uncharacterized protein n=1 Tax=Aspergillus nanangensis TaxID=2582783 RepID=A0AAD4GV29_ASPNN|nr:hypothetical protein FE257_008025 [Aspergillus nanangensis]
MSDDDTSDDDSGSDHRGDYDWRTDYLSDDDHIPWGVLPIEQYLINTWDYASVEPPAQQRVRLLGQFLRLDRFPEEWCSRFRNALVPARFPTVAENRLILWPWRSQDMRLKAWKILQQPHKNQTDEFPFLFRTYYSVDKQQRALDDEKIKNWIASTKRFKRAKEFVYFDDAELFNFGPHWQRLYEVIPEVVGPRSGSCERKQSPSETDIWMFKRGLFMLKESLSDVWRDGSKRVIEVASEDLRTMVIKSYLLIADQVAFETDHLSVPLSWLSLVEQFDGLIIGRLCARPLWL